MMSNFQNAPQTSQAAPQLRQSYSGQEALNMGLGGSQQQNYGGGYGGGFMPQMQSPFSSQRQSYQPQYNPYQQYENSLGSYNPYQMQSPFSYQQQSYQPSYQSSYGGYGGGYDEFGNNPQPMQPTPQRTSSGPIQSIISRSAQMRGTPNVMRRAEGGITSLMDDVE
jgi:hypothetical protein